MTIELSKDSELQGLAYQLKAMRCSTITVTNSDGSPVGITVSDVKGKTKGTIKAMFQEIIDERKAVRLAQINDIAEKATSLSTVKDFFANKELASQLSDKARENFRNLVDNRKSALTAKMAELETM